MKTKHKDEYFECMNLEIAQRLRARAGHLLNSPLKFTKKGRPFFWVKFENLCEVENEYQLILQDICIEALDKTVA